MKEYSNFDLEIDRAPEGFRVRASSEEKRETRNFGYPFPDRGWEEPLLEPGSGVREVRPAWVERCQTAEEIGGQLFRAVFDRKILSLWSTALILAAAKRRGLRLRVCGNDADVASWPWELLVDPERPVPLALATETPIVRFPVHEKEIGPPRPLSPLRILVVTAAPPGCPPLEPQREWEGLQESFGDLIETGDVELHLLEGVSLAALSRRLRNPLRAPVHILHFIGHGTFDRERKEGQLIFEDGEGGTQRVNGRALAAVLQNRKHIRLVVLNACEGARRAGGDAFSSVAESVIHEGIPAVIAMRSVVTDRAAQVFARAFYEELAEGEPLEAALGEARTAMYAAAPASAEWATPAFFLCAPSGRLFRISRWRRSLQRMGLTRRGLSIALLLVLAGLALRPGTLPSIPRLTEPESHRLAPDLPLPETASIVGCPESTELEMTFVRIEGDATFTMGSKPMDPEERRHRVTISRSFCMAVHEVTRAQWRKVMGTVPGEGREDWLPVTEVSWDDIEDFLGRLNKLEPGANYRRPTEAEWEYAARLAATTLFSFGDDPSVLYLHGNCQSGKIEDGHDGLAPVGSYQPNSWGLYDMHGNTSEWVEDWYDVYPEEHATDPQGPRNGEEKVRRGGSFKIKAENCSGVSRNHSKPGKRSRDVGFRLVRPVRP